MAEYEINPGVSNDLTGVDVSTCALVVIDETGQVEGTPLEGPLLAPILRTAQIAKVAREQKVPVIFTIDAHIKGIDPELELWGEHGLKDDPNARPCPQLDVQPEDYVVEKMRYSSFFQTHLRLLLDELGAKTLILCGFDTNICVKHTAADAYFNGYDLIVVSDATETFLIGDQAEGLEYMNRCYAAKIATTEQIIALLS